jgi:four helix bundle protein
MQSQVNRMGDHSFKTFEDLQCWQACRDVRLFIINIIKNYPKEEKYSIVDNMKRAARSTTQNIAEGFGRFHYRENLQFCRISRGSLFELIDDLITSVDEGFITQEDYQLGRDKISNALAILNGYIRYLNGRLTNNK